MKDFGSDNLGLSQCGLNYRYIIRYGSVEYGN